MDNDRFYPVISILQTTSKVHPYSTFEIRIGGLRIFAQRKLTKLYLSSLDSL
jgi:hypothetical protein